MKEEGQDTLSVYNFITIHWTFIKIFQSEPTITTVSTATLIAKVYSTYNADVENVKETLCVCRRFENTVVWHCTEKAITLKCLSHSKAGGIKWQIQVRQADRYL